MNNIEEKALSLLEVLENNHYQAYIVGGFIRDKLIGKISNDVDITTTATPKEIMELFPNTSSPSYGSINIIYKNTNFDITTLRKEIKYENNRKPVKIKYIKNLKKDLLRRDFTINTLCMDKNGNIIDELNVMDDIHNKVIRTVGNPRYRLKEDSLRILRAIRFATLLNFEIEAKTKHYLKEYAYLLKKLSYQRKKEELDKIFTSKNKEIGIKLLLELKINESLKLNNLASITPCDDLLGIWTQLQVDDIYPFTKVEHQQMKKIREFLTLDIYDKYNIYKYGLYTTTVAYKIKNIPIHKLTNIYQNLPIKSHKDIAISPQEIPTLLSKKPGKYINEILTNLEKNIISNKLKNTKEDIKAYILKNYES